MAFFFTQKYTHKLSKNTGKESVYVDGFSLLAEREKIFRYISAKFDLFASCTMLCDIIMRYLESMVNKSSKKKCLFSVSKIN